MKLNINLIIGIILFRGSIFFILMYVNLLIYKKLYFIEYEVLNINSSSIIIRVILDWISTSFIRFVILISFVIVIYRISYIRGDQNSRFFIVLIFRFVMSIILLIISPNLLRILLGWDGLGLISYCLVIYYQNVKSYNAGIVTAITNRIGDVLILIRIAWIINFGSWNYLFYYDYDTKGYSWIIWLIVLAAITKRAQIPFSSWLPAAMAAPTPVSALVHSSTLVTAGVYLLIRFSFIFDNLTLNYFLIILSVLTIFISGLGAVFDHDLKKIIALSTLRQLGLMISRLCLGLYEFAFFHLLSHALFKSLLFICAGYIIHIMNDSQDIRYIGRVFLSNPVLSIYFNISNLSLCGIPFLAGFYSKDLILEKILIININIFIFLLYFLSILFTVIYTFRLLYIRIINCLKFNLFNRINDNDLIILGWIFIIIFMVIIGGSFISWTMFFDEDCIVLPLYLKIFVSILILLGIFLGYYFSKIVDINRRVSAGLLIYLMSEMWFLPYLSTYSLNYLILNLGYSYRKLIDLGWMELIGGQGIYIYIINYSSILTKIIYNVRIFILLYLLLLFIFIRMLICLNSLYRAWYWRYQGNLKIFK